jgi:hypothetical protein
MVPLVGLPSWARLLDWLDVPREWSRRIQEVTDLIGALAMPTPAAPPEPVIPTGVDPLHSQLVRAAVRSPGDVEALARGALIAGHGHEELVEWALARCVDPVEREGAAAVACAVIRERGYRPLLSLADGDPPLPAVITVPMGRGADPSLFAVPRGPYLLAAGTRRRFLRDYPYLRQALAPQPQLDHAALFRPEAVMALAQEQEFLALLGQVTTAEFENDILPISRVPGLNILVLAGLLIDELLDPMEILDWIGADINNLPRTPIPDRPENLKELPKPGTDVNGRPAKYMIFADVHLDAPQDLAFRVGHFSDNEALFLRALQWCDDNDFTVLSLGDAIEMWVEPTFDPGQRQSKLDRLKEIVQLHQAVFDKLADLAADGRYFECIGNHNSYLWEDPQIVAWRAANPSFPEIHGGFIIRLPKTMDDLLPHIGLDPDNYDRRADMLLLHGHQFDFWNCDEHNRLGKFITNAVVPLDAFAKAVYDFRGVDRLGHPLVEFWDVLTSFTPWDNWPPKEVARKWAEEIEYRPFVDNLTVDSIIFLESLAALFGYLMRSGSPSLFNYSVMICMGHTHNPQSRPWIPFFERFNPWRDDELFGVPVFQNLFALKSRYITPGTSGWWEGIVWAVRITEEGQPQLCYMSEEDDDFVPMDWELPDDSFALPPSPLAGLLAWADQYLDKDIRAGLEAAQRLFDAAADLLPVARDGRGTVLLEPSPPPDLSTLAGLLAAVAGGGGPVRPALPLVSASAMAAMDRAGLGSNLATAGLLLAARHDEVFAGVRPAPAGQPGSRGGTVGLTSVGATVMRELMPQLMAGCPPADTVPALDVGALLGGLLWPHARRPPRLRPRASKQPETGGRPAPAGSGLRIRVPDPLEEA